MFLYFNIITKYNKLEQRRYFGVKDKVTLLFLIINDLKSLSSDTQKPFSI